MKSDLKGPKKPEVVETKYPCLKLHYRLGFAVLFSGPEVGMVVHDVKGVWPIGHGGKNWAEPDFELLRGKITLSN